ncbi:hypothetical protein [Beijerinckia sp. L45]|uniref:hypothetical protein n=1 Tax=Beijerinckia sp. L45 TaxID=1641855 RepID=UPI00131EB188|nr:hypothetical protein [Beijerinckia sp. L45]
MKAFIIGIWVLIVALGATYASAYFDSNRKAPGAELAVASVVQAEKTRVINVPMIANGAVQGFVVAQFGYTVDAAMMKKVAVSPEVFILDEAFRTLYSDDHLDFAHIERYDINKLTTHLVQATNERLGATVVKAILIQDFTYFSKQETEH